MLHHLLQRCGITPDEFYAKPKKVQDFLRASVIVELEGEAEVFRQIKGG